MIRLLARVAPIALMAVPLVIYRNHFEGLDRSFDWRAHTYEARASVERIGRHASLTPRPDLLAGDIDAFAETTADNPAQVRRAAEMRAAIGRSDMTTLARTIDEAIADEDALLLVRSAEAKAKLDELRRLADIVLGFGVAIMVLREFIDFAERKASRLPAPSADRVDGDRARADLEAMLRERDQKNLAMASLLNDARARLAPLEARYGREMAYAETRQILKDMIHQLDPSRSGEEESGLDG